MMFDGYGWGWGAMGFGFLGMLLFWGLLVAVVLALLKWAAGSSNRHPPAKPEKSALSILDERYARGEIDRDEYLLRRNDLKS